MNEYILKSENLGKTLGSVQAVKNVNLAIAPGEAVALLGPSGSGKSTLLGLLAGLERPGSGRVLLAGQDLNEFSEDRLALLRREQIGFVFQAFHLIPTLSALENVAFPLYPTNIPARERRRRAGEILDRVGLARRSSHLPAKLSGGERQRVAIARALVNNPSLIFCDEPSGNLDSATGAEILDLLFGLNQDRKVSLFIVTHDQALSRRAHRTLNMHDGEVSIQ